MTVFYHSLHGCTLAVLLLITLAGGCATTSRTSDFYTLSSTIPKEQETQRATNCRDVVIGIGPVLWPRYLDRPQIVTRLSANRISFDEFHRWAGPLGEEFERVLIDDLSRLLQTEYVIKYPGKLAYTPRYRIQIQINQFDGQPGGAVILKADWSIIGKLGENEPVLHESLIHQVTAGEGYEDMVAAASEAVAELSRQITAEVSARCAVTPAK